MAGDEVGKRKERTLAANEVPKERALADDEVPKERVLADIEVRKADDELKARIEVREMRASALADDNEVRLIGEARTTDSAISRRATFWKIVTRCQLSHRHTIMS